MRTYSELRGFLVVPEGRVDDAVARMGALADNDLFLKEGHFFAEVVGLYQTFIDVDLRWLDHAPGIPEPQPDQAVSEVSLCMEGQHDLFLFGVDGGEHGEPWPAIALDPAVRVVRVRATGWGREQAVREMQHAEYQSRVAEPAIERYLIEVWSELRYRDRQIIARNARFSTSNQ